jgi:hypothetical protein
MRRMLHRLDDDGRILEKIPLWGYVTIQDGVAKRMEITTCLDELARYLGDELLPLFNIFLERT